LTRLFFFNLILQHWIDWEYGFLIIIILFAFYGFIKVLWLGLRIRQIDLDFFVPFLLEFSSILNWLRIKLYNLFQFILYKVVLVLLTRSQVWSVNSSGCFMFFFLIDFILNFHPLILGWLKIEFHNLFWYAFHEVILVSWPKFDMLTRVDSTCFFSWISFSILSFNIELIKNWV
jgi:hypothetical protein